MMSSTSPDLLFREKVEQTIQNVRFGFEIFVGLHGLSDIPEIISKEN